MKVNILLKIVDGLLIGLYVALMFMPAFQKIWFSTALGLVAITLLLASAFFVQDSKLWLGSLLMLSGVFGVYKQFYGFNLFNVYPVYIFIFGLASLIVFVIFRQNIHLKVFVICSLEVLLLGIYKFAYVNLWEFVFLQVALVLFVLTNMAKRANINTRSN